MGRIAPHSSAGKLFIGKNGKPCKFDEPYIVTGSTWIEIVYTVGKNIHRAIIFVITKTGLRVAVGTKIQPKLKYQKVAKTGQNRASRILFLKYGSAAACAKNRIERYIFN